MVTVLIIHNDLGFTFWLGQALNEAGYAALPAKTVSEAIDLISEHKIQADLLVINPLLHGVRDLIAKLRRSNPGMKVIASSEVEGQTCKLFWVDHSVLKPAGGDEALRQRWLKTIQELLQLGSATE